MVTLQQICSLISDRFPEKCAEDWDNPGLQLGRRAAGISRVLTALELTPDIVEEAVSTGADLVLTHHPFIFRPFKSLTDADPDGRMLLTLAESHIALLAAHTNLDAAPNAIAQKLSDDLGLTGTAPLVPHQPYAPCKIVVFVPVGAAESVTRAMHDAGAGCIGEYRDASFRSDGEGRYTGSSASHPAIGTPGIPERTPETRIEMIASERDLNAVIRALIAAHPYEEPAYDVIKLASDVRGISDLYGFGTVGDLPAATTLSGLIAHIKDIWDIPAIRASGSPDTPIRRLAILNGSGAKFIRSCPKCRADAYITGDCGHHDFDYALRLGIPLIDAGHYDTEKFIPAILADTLKSAPFADQLDISVAKSMKNPMRIY